MPHAEFELERITVAFGATVALDDLTLTIGNGERVAFVGPSGAGKTTMLRVLSGMTRPDRGRARIGGRDLSSLSPDEVRQLRARLGNVHQDLRLVPNLSALRNVLSGRLGRWSMATSLKHMLFPSRAMAEDVHGLLDRLGIGEKLYQRVDTLSGGQRQRVAIARALFQEPVALFADEPVASVDPARARDLVALLDDLCRERHLTLCVSLHDLELARTFFPRLIGLRDGRLIFDRATEEIGEDDLAALYRLGPDRLGPDRLGHD